MLEDVLKKGFAEADRDLLTQAANSTRVDLLHALQSRDWKELLALEQEINDALVAYRRVIRSEAPDESFFVGQLYAMQGIARACRESHASPDDIFAAKRSKDGLRMLTVLYKQRSLMAAELREELGIKDATRLSQVGSRLEQAGLVRKDRIGVEVSYRLTAAGDRVARDIVAHDKQSVSDIVPVDRQALVRSVIGMHEMSRALVAGSHRYGASQVLSSELSKWSESWVQSSSARSCLALSQVLRSEGVGCKESVGTEKNASGSLIGTGGYCEEAA